MRPARFFACILVFAGCTPAPAAREVPPDPRADVEAARAVFTRNIEAIQRKDREAYLACYRADDALIRNGPGGPKLGFADLASTTASTASGWPRSLEATDVQLHWLGPGYVYGSYQYRVDFGGSVSRGVSERVFARHHGQWKIVVSTAFGGPVSSDEKLADLAFLTGTWVEQKDGLWTEESWSPARGGTMMGSGRTIEGGQTRAFEHLRIEHTAGAIDLVAMPGGQPAVRFRLIERTAESAVFENRAHDFPQRVAYRREADRLHARIEGGDRSVTWTYQRQ